MKVKPWQIAVIVLGLVLGVGLIVYSFAGADGPKVNSIEYLVDVETGDLFRVDLEKRAVGLPARHPTSRRICLVRINKNDTGKWTVSKRDRGLLRQLDKDVVNKAIDTDTGELLVPEKSPVEYTPTK